MGLQAVMGKAPLLDKDRAKSIVFTVLDLIFVSPRSLQTMLEQEMETSSVLRAEIEQMKHTSTARQEKEQAKLQALQK